MYGFFYDVSNSERIMKKIRTQIVTFVTTMIGYIGLVYAGFSIYDGQMYNESMGKLYEIMNKDRFYHYESMEERTKAFEERAKALDNVHLAGKFEFVNMGGWYEIKNWPWVINYIERGYKGEIRHYTMVPTAVTIQSWMNSVDKDYIIGCLNSSYNKCVDEIGDGPIASYDEINAICEKFSEEARNNLYFVRWNSWPNKDLNNTRWINVGLSSVKVEINCSGIDELTRIYTFEDTRNSYLLIGLLVIVVVGLFVIGSSYSDYYSNQKKLKSTLHYKLLTACNPSNFLKPYNKELVDKANLLYQQVSSTSPNDEKRLKELRSTAVDELGVNFIDINELNELKKKCDPSLFMKPYNPDKISKANEFYAILTSKDLTIDKLEQIKEEVLLLNEM